MASATFLGTGNYLVPEGRYWSSFVLDGTVLVEPAPTCLPHLRRCGIRAGDIDVVVVSHFHPDHTFGWPFLLLELVRDGRERPLFVVGPPETERFLAEMMRLAAVENVQKAAHELLDVRYVEVDGSWQQAGTLRFRGIEVEHVPDLRCFGYLLDRGDRVVGYSGDLHPCPGLDELAEGADALVLECNGAHPPPPTHMTEDDVRALRSRYPDLPLVLTHLGDGIDVADVEGVRVADDFETLEL